MLVLPVLGVPMVGVLLMVGGHAFRGKVAPSGLSYEKNACGIAARPPGAHPSSGHRAQ
ncbi:hypothetical protein ACQP2K_28195 [Microbispora siamensis]